MKPKCGLKSRNEDKDTFQKYNLFTEVSPVSATYIKGKVVSDDFYRDYTNGRDGHVRPVRLSQKVTLSRH
nr:hypothetical protein [Tanacetum cinerariifolium]